MLSAPFLLRSFQQVCPAAIDKALILKKEGEECIYLWSRKDPIATINQWIKLFGKKTKVRAALSSSIAPELNQLYDAATPLPLEGVRRCKG